MKTGILITARLGSTRLEKKHLLKVNEKEIICFLIDRINYEFKKEIEKKELLVIISTGNKEKNNKLSHLNSNYSIFYGDDSNIPKRHLETAEENNLDNIISIDGDDILCSVKAMKIVYKELKKGERFVKTEGLPLGLNVSGYKTKFLKKSLENIDLKTLETGWGRIFDKKKIKTIKIKSEDKSFLRFTLDYKEDFNFFKKILLDKNFDLYKTSDKELIKLVLGEKLFKENEKRSEEYWENFNKSMEKEG